MDRQYYKDYYILERNHWWFLARAEILLSTIKKMSKVIECENPKILNIGVATYKTSEMLKELGEVTSIEYDKECCDFIVSELGKDVINASITELPFENNSFDLVCAFDVIEHVEDDQRAVNEMLRVCRNQADVFITVPAYKFLWSEHDLINHHFRRYTRKTLESLFKFSGSTIRKSSYFNFILFPPIAFIRIIKRLLPSRTNPESDFNSFKSNVFNRILYHTFLLEKHLLNRFRLPFGVSILLMISKNNKN